MKATDGQEVIFAAPRGPTKLSVLSDAASQNVPLGGDEDKIYSRGGYVVVQVETRGEVTQTDAQSNELARQSSSGAETPAARNSADAGVVTKMALGEVEGGGVEVYLATDSLNLREQVWCIANDVLEKRPKAALAAQQGFAKTGGINGPLRIDGSANVADTMTKNSNTLARALAEGRLNLETLT